MRPVSPPPSTLNPPRFPAQFKRAAPPDKPAAARHVRGSRTTLDDYRAYTAAVSEGWNVAPASHAPRTTPRISISNSGAHT
jgi:hypothetical protein